MAQTKIFTCDICGRTKQQSNHWFKVRIKEAFHVYRWDFWGEGADDNPGDLSDFKHVCGQQHLLILFQAWMDGSVNTGTIP